MPDRIAELRRQRALLQEHLAWLDREIARETARETASSSTGLTAPEDPLTRDPRDALQSFRPIGASAPPTPLPAASRATTPLHIAKPDTTSTPIAASPSAAATSASGTRVATDAPEIDAMLNEYRVPSDSVRTDVRKGCFLYFAAAIALLAAIVAVLYFTLTPR
jgi:hypothetical protein